MSKKILIIGGTGFLGYHTAINAIKKKWIVHSISSKPPLKKRFCKDVKYIICDISKKKKIKKIIKINYDFIINFGGYVNHSDAKKTLITHFSGCKNVVDTLLNQKLIPNKFIQVGSSIENLKKKSPQKEFFSGKKKVISSVYGNSKLMATRYLINLFKKKKFPAIIIRPYIIYGPKQDPNRFIPFVIENCKKNNSFELSDCEQYRDFLYIDDFINLLFKILKSNSKSLGNIFNVGFGKPTKLKKIVTFIKNKIQKGDPIYGKLKLRPDEIKILYPNLKKTKKFFNWSPKISISHGLIKTIKFN